LNIIEFISNLGFNTKVTGQLVSFETASARLLVGISAGSMFLAITILGFYFTASHLAFDWQNSIKGQATLHIMAGDDQEAHLEAALNILADQDAILDITQIDKADVENILEPLIGKIEAELPLPIIAKITISSEITFDVDDLQKDFAELGLNAKIDKHSEWQRAAHKIGYITKTSAMIVLICVGLVTAGIIAFVSRATLISQIKTIEVLRVVGAEDRFIASLFERRFIIFGFIGGIIGLILALIAALTLYFNYNPTIELGPQGYEWVIVFCMPLVMAFFIGFITRLSILRHLRKELTG